MSTDDPTTPSRDDEQSTRWAPKPPSLAPSSEPFYPVIPAAPISSTGYSQAPRVAPNAYSVDESTNPYSGMGYDTLPTEHPPGMQQSAQPGPQAPPAIPGQPHQSVGPHPTGPAYRAGEPPAVEDLFKAPGNPYADLSGRAAPAPSSSSPTHSATAHMAPGGSVPPGTYAQPGSHAQPVTTPGMYPGGGVAPGSPQPKTKGVGCLVTLIVLAVVGALLVSGLVGIVKNFGLPESTSTTVPSPSPTQSLATVADTDLDAGLCFDTLEYVRGNHLQPIACAEPHRFEVAQNVPAPFADYPGDEEMSDFAAEQCESVADDITAQFSTRKLTPHSLYPSPGTWANGDHMVTCFISIAGSPRLHGSAHDGDLEVH